MSTKIKTPTAFASKRLLEAVLSAPIEALACPDSYAMICYVQEEDAGRANPQIREHVQTCDACANFVDGVQAGLRDLERERRIVSWLASQRSEATGSDTSTAHPRGVTWLPLAPAGSLRPMLEGQAFDSASPIEGRTPDGQLSWRLVDEGAELVATFETVLPELIDAPSLRLRCGDVATTLTFLERAGRIVATAILPKVAIGGWDRSCLAALEVDGLPIYRETPPFAGAR